MKHEEYRQSISQRLSSLRIDPPGPCMSGTLDLELYNRTGEVKMIKPFKVFIPPGEGPKVKKAGRIWVRPLSPGKPQKDKLERDLRSGMSAPEIAKKYDSSTMTVYNWIRSYGLQGIRGKKRVISQ